MSNYIREAQCGGAKPKKHRSCEYIMRNSALAKMMRDRGRIRYLVAPSGFGKTYLALSYADLVRAFSGVHWFDASSPCFSRDLDAGCIVEECAAKIGRGDILILDNLQGLDDQRAKAVRGLCRIVLGRGGEVVVCATPSENPLGQFSDDCLVLDYKDLLYDDNDLKSLIAVGAPGRSDSEPVRVVDRIPALARRMPGSFRSFLCEHIDEIADPFEVALSFAMLVLERGNCAELSRVMTSQVKPADAFRDELRPFIETSRSKGEFDAAGFPLDEVLKAFAPHMQRIAQALGDDDANRFATSLGDALLHRGCSDRAVQVITTLCDVRVCGFWLEARQDRLLDRCCFSSAEKMHIDILATNRMRMPVLLAGSALRKLVAFRRASDLDALIRYSSRADQSSDWPFAFASIAFASAGNSTMRSRLSAMLDKIGSSRWRESRPQANTAPADDRVFWKHAFDDDGGIGAVLKANPEPSTWLLASCLQSACTSRVGVRAQPEVLHAIEHAFLRCDESGASSLGEAILVRILKASRIIPKHLSLPPAVLRRCEICESTFDVQTAALMRMETMPKMAYSTAQSVAQDCDDVFVVRDLKTIPKLEVRLFGGFDVLSGGVPLDDAGFTRPKVRALMALLVMNAGRDLSVEGLSKRLWRDSTPKRALSNFNSVYCHLRRVLKLSDGTCPYFARPHGVVRMDATMVTSDAARLEQVCRHVRLDPLDSESFTRWLEDIKGVRCGEFLPGVTDDPVIIGLRSDFANRTGTIVIDAARRLNAAGKCLTAMGYAQYAMDLNPSREDSYEVLMVTQALCGQRPAAVETWLAYIEFMKDEFGLGPSDRMQNLYRQIIDDDLSTPTGAG